MKRPTDGDWGDAPLTTDEAAEWLHQQFPSDKEDYWRWFLINNRRAGRRPPHRVPFSRQKGQVVYEKGALQALVAFEQRRRPGGGIKLTGQAAQVMAAFELADDRKLPRHAVKRHGGPRPFIQLVIEDPLTVYRLTPTEAQQLAVELMEAAKDRGDRHG